MLRQRPAEHGLARAPSPKIPTTSASTTTTARRDNIDQHKMQVAVTVVVSAEQDLTAEGPRALRELLPADGADPSAVDDAAATTGATQAISARAGHF